MVNALKALSHPTSSHYVLTTFFPTFEQVQSSGCPNLIRKFVARPLHLYYVHSVRTQFEPVQKNVVRTSLVKRYYGIDSPFCSVTLNDLSVQDNNSHVLLAPIQYQLVTMHTHYDFYSAVSLGDQAAGILVQYPTQSISPFIILTMPSVRPGSDKCQPCTRSTDSTTMCSYGRMVGIIRLSQHGGCICSLSYFPFQSVNHNWSIKGVQSSLWKSAYKRSLAAYQKK